MTFRRNFVHISGEVSCICLSGETSRTCIAGETSYICLLGETSRICISEEPHVFIPQANHSELHLWRH